MYDILFKISDPIGILGVALILLAYFLLSIGRWASNSVIYHTFNFIGAWMILFSLYFNWNLSGVVIEIAWIIISAAGFCRALKGNKIRNAGI